MKRILVATCALALLSTVPVYAQAPAAPAVPAAPAAPAAPAPRPQSPKPPPKIGVGQPAPDFTLPTLGGKDFTLSSLKGNKVVVLALTQSACRNCVDELKFLSKLTNKNVEIFAVNVDAKGGTEAWQQRIAEMNKENEITVPFLLDPKFTVGRAFKVTSTPSMIVIGKDGIITHVRIGFDPDDDKKEVGDLINGL